MANSTNWTFTPLATNTRGVFIGKCQGWLPNRMQCTRAAEYQATDNSTDPPTQAGQYCKAHMLHIQAGVAIAPIAAIPNTGTVQAQPVPEELFEVKTPSGVTEKVELVPVINENSDNNPNLNKEANGNNANSSK